jgi:hydroxypyruvate isomerase
MFAFSANLSTLFTDLPLPERFATAKAAGFDAVEWQFPYAHPADELAQHLKDAGQRLVLHILPVGDGVAGEPGTGEIRHAFLFDWLERIGCRGPVGREYFQADKEAGGTPAGLGWLAAHGRLPTGQKHTPT